MGRWPRLARPSRDRMRVPSVRSPARLALTVAVAAIGVGATRTLTSAAGERPPAVAAAVAVRAAAPERDKTAPAALWIEMRNVDLHIDERASLRVRHLRGEAIATRPDAVVVLDDPRSFRVRATAGTVALRGDDLSVLLNTVVFGGRRSSLTKLAVHTEGNEIVQTGVLRKGVRMRFTLHGALSLTADGRVRMHPTRLRIFGVNGQKLLHALGLRLSDLIDMRGARGAAVEGDDILLDPLAIIPPPTVTGRLASVGVEGPEIVLTFARAADDSVFDGAVRPNPAAHNFVYFRGGRLRFGKLEMRDTDLLIRDADERDPLDLYLARYTRQLVAGYSRTLANEGLEVVMPDYAALGRVATPLLPALH